MTLSLQILGKLTLSMVEIQPIKFSELIEFISKSKFALSGRIRHLFSPRFARLEHFLSLSLMSYLPGSFLHEGPCQPAEVSDGGLLRAR